VESEKRRFFRIKDLQIPVRFEFGFETQNQVLREISEAGMFVTSSEPPPVGTDIQLVILDEQEEISVPARVIYTNVGYSIGDRAFSGMGLALGEKLDESTKQKWYRLIDRVLEEVAALQDSPEKS
jgi:Tfp pilus assembly protein PilZ